MNAFIVLQIVVSALLGACLGSFFNVVAWRGVPGGEKSGPFANPAEKSSRP